MTVTRVLILGHSLIRRLREYIGSNADLDVSLHILDGIALKWHGVGGRTVLKTVQFDLSVVELFKPDIVILQLGTNDLSHLPAVNVGQQLKTLPGPSMTYLTSNVFMSVKLFIEQGHLILTRM